MRLWSIHPKYLDTKGLVAVWREGLLAKKVLQGKTKGYTKHPQLTRFRNNSDPASLINQYLAHILYEAVSRGYNFDERKVDLALIGNDQMIVTSGQLKYEFSHLKNKLKTRSPKDYANFTLAGRIDPHPLFQVVKGDIEPWEIVLREKLLSIK